MFNTDSKCKHRVDRKMVINSSIKDNTSRSLPHSLCNMNMSSETHIVKGMYTFGVAAENSSKN